MTSIAATKFEIEPEESVLDTILTLPRQTDAIAMAEMCREASVEFLNEGKRWGKPELAMWLMGPYAQCTRYLGGERHKSGQMARPVLLSEIDVRMVERVIGAAHEQVISELRKMRDDESSASFTFTMLANGFVARCQDDMGVSGFVPTSKPVRLADRVLSLVAADYLTRPAEYDMEMSVCELCNCVDFDGVARMRGTCSRHGSGMFLPRSRRTTKPYLPEGA